MKTFDILIVLAIGFAAGVVFTIYQLGRVTRRCV